jgi:hypothetical protein
MRTVLLHGRAARARAPAALLYIAAFGIGTVSAMTGFAAVVGWTGARLHHHASTHRGLMAATAVLAIVVGGVWLVV